LARTCKTSQRQTIAEIELTTSRKEEFLQLKRFWEEEKIAPCNQPTPGTFPVWSKRKTRSEDQNQKKKSKKQ